MKRIIFLFLLLPALATAQTTVTTAICDGDSIFLANSWQTTAGTYTDVTPTGTIITTLVINPLPIISPNFSLNGNAIMQPGNIYQLTAAANSQSGSVWNNIMINLNNPFHFDIDMFFGCNTGGADGMAFVLQPISTSIGTGGGGIGYSGVTPSFAVEFDTWQNTNVSDPFHNHIAIQKNGNLNHSGTSNLAGPSGFPPGNSSIEDCQWHNVIFDWVPSTNTFTVTFDGNNVISYTGNIVANIFNNNPVVYWGVTAATGGANNLQQFKFNYELSDTSICQNDSVQIYSSAISSSYSYLWTPNYNISNDTVVAPFFSPDTTTTYTLSVTNSYGCPYVDSFTITVDSIASINFSPLNSACTGDPVFLLNTATPAGGTYSGPGVGNNYFNPNPNTLGTNTITYSYTSPLAGCTSTATQNIEVYSSPTATATISNVSCNGLFDGNAILNISGGTPSYSQNWGTNNPLALGVGTHQYTIIDTNNCSYTDSVNIVEPGPFSSTITTTPTSCNGFSDGAATIQLSGSSTPIGAISTLNYCNSYPGTSQYATIDQVQLTGDNYTINNITTGSCDAYEDYTNQYADITEGQTYSVYVALDNCNGFNFTSGGKVFMDWNIDGDFTDPGEEIGTIPYGLGTSATINFIVPLSGPFGATRMRVVSQHQSTPNVSAIGPCQTGVWAPFYFAPWYGATEDYSIIIHSSTISASYLWSTLDTSSSINNVQAGTYTVEITNANGCVLNDTLTITEPNSITTINTALAISCNGLADGSFSIDITGGTPNYTVNALWSSQLLNNGASTYNTSSTLSAGLYPFSIIDSNSCSYSDTITIIEPQAIAITANTSNVNCYNASDGSIDVSVVGGTTPFTYLWSNGEVTEDINNLTAGNYSLIVTDSSSCSENIALTITQPTGQTLSFTKVDASCFGYTDGSIDLTVSGTGLNTFSWSNGDTTEDLTNIGAGIYTVFVTSANGCIDSLTITINTPIGPIITFSQVNASCNNSNNGSIDISTSGGSTPFTYLWSNGAITEDLTNIAAANYIYNITDLLGCVFSDTITITQPTTLTVNASSSDVLCFGSSNGSAILTMSGGTTPYNEDWGGNNPLALSAGSFNYTVTDSNGCSLSDSIVINEPTAISISSTIADVSCNGFSNGGASLSISGGTAPYLEDWGGNNPLALPAGSFNYTVTDSNGCSLSDSIVINEPTAISTSTSITNVLCFGSSDASVTLTISGGTAPYLEDWAGSNPQALNAGTHLFTITDINNCTLQGQTIVTEPTDILITKTLNHVTCFGEDNGAATLQISGGVSPYTQNWNGINTSTLEAGLYPFTVIDSNNCIKYDTITISQPDTLRAIANIVNAGCFDGNNGQVLLNIVGGTPPYTENWGGNNPLALSAGAYTFSILDANSCTFDSSAVVLLATNVSLSYNTESPICKGEFSTLDIVISNSESNQFNVIFDDFVNNQSYSYTIDSLGFTIPGGVPIEVNPLSTTNLILTSIADDNGCESNPYDSSAIEVVQLPLLSLDIDNICKNSPSFTITSGFPVGGNYLIENNLTNYFEMEDREEGSYSVVYNYTDSITTCSNTIENIFKVLPIPTAEFYSAPKISDIENPDIIFINTSANASSYEWDFIGTTQQNNNNSLIHTFSDTGTYNVQLIAINDYNCTDTAINTVIINPVYKVFIPSSFTPNNDDKNDLFYPSLVGIKYYTIYIYSRWGEVIYKGNTPWDGGNMTSGNYGYVIEVVNFRGEVFKYTDVVALIR